MAFVDRRRAKELIERCAWRLGWDVTVRRADPRFRSRDLRDYSWLARLAPRTVLDIGAHHGATARLYRRLLPGAAIHSFEPIASSYRELVRTMGGDENFYPHQVALGRACAVVSFGTGPAAETSSLKVMSAEMKALFPHAAHTSFEQVAMDTLDAVMSGVALEDPVMIKLDVQGSELETIDGGAKTFRRAGVALVETSFHALYAGQPTFPEVNRRLEELGFRYAGSLRQLLSPIDHAPLEQDAIFLRSE